ELERLQDAFLARGQPMRELGDRRLAAEGGRECVPGHLDAHHQLLQLPRRAERPRPVPEVPPQLPQDRRDREAAECGSALRVEAVDRLQEPEAGDLLEVLSRLPGLAIAVRKAAGEWQIA